MIEDDQPAIGVMVTRCKTGFVLSPECNPATFDLHAATSMEEVTEILIKLFKLREP